MNSRLVTFSWLIHESRIALTSLYPHQFVPSPVCTLTSLYPHQFVLVLLQLLGLGLVQRRGYCQIDLILSRESYTVCELSSLCHIESKVQILILALLNTRDKNFQ
ncbi:MAG: hypothetical protein JOS17DRAFT_792911 [Linnemannia elongata]|nr:MAG: hypothetical protein JOS17DRAFT_792911 [Linnemannia elongata]